MKPFGIYTLGNDVVYDQIVALVNSIERNVSQEIPICIIPYDSNVRKTRQLVEARPQLSLFDNEASMQRWERFARNVWEAHPQAASVGLRRIPKWFKQAQLMRKMCAFDGEFEQFVFYDADSLAMGPLDRVIAHLQTYDFVFDDWEHSAKTASASFKFDLIQSALGLSEAAVRPQMHCSSFFGAHRDFFHPGILRQLQERLVEQREINWISDHAFWCDADLFSYMTFRSGAATFNFSLSSDSQERTGNTADAPYVNIDQVLFNKEGMKPIHRLHFITYASELFTRLCQGEAIDLPAQDVFLFYRFLHEPERQPLVFRPPSPVVVQMRSIQHNLKKVQKLVS
jgi:hypothetical protein